MILLIATFISNMGDNPVVNGAMAGLRAAALGLVVVAVIQMASKVFKGFWTIVAAAASFILIAVFNINTAYVILLFVTLGIASAFIGGNKSRTDSADQTGDRKGGAE